MLTVSGFENVNTAGGNDTVTGTAGVNTIYSGAGNDGLALGGAADVAHAGEGADTVSGGDGNDTICGYQGADLLGGEAGADSFRYTGISASTMAEFDTIEGFVRGQDKLDLTGFYDLSFDVTPGVTRLCDFTFIGAHRFSGDADELRFKNGLLTGDTNQDGIADFAIKLTGLAGLGAGDFVFT